ncbi:protein of unknown function [Candidatus Filomicrobium marinum]|uniref:Uncharacterized protein n=1 Tax=Candidatus Filomicrobium marinum TaxID=1608628 RepID=A0A0D6JBK0_9HYPH|nr:protein of unknown function [Candidatus Filomicrobium marinum]CPR16234.1 protein of unknown function [Candidatus Filomicrobium marinum]
MSTGQSKLFHPKWFPTLSIVAFGRNLGTVLLRIRQRRHILLGMDFVGVEFDLVDKLMPVSVAAVERVEVVRRFSEGDGFEQALHCYGGEGNPAGSGAAEVIPESLCGLLGRRV